MTLKTALITSGRMPIALELSRSLHKLGVRVVAVDCVKRYICQSSSSVDKSYVIPSPSKDYEAYKKSIIKISADEKIDFIFPTTEDVFFLSKFVDDLPPRCELFASSRELLLKLHHKQMFIDFAQSIGLAVPQSVPHEGGPLPSFTEQDYILKKVYSRAGTGVLFAKAGKTPKDYSLPTDGSWLIQEKLKGKQFCSCTILDHGKVIANIVYEPAVINGTTSIVFKEVAVPSVDSWIQNFADKTSFHGTVSFDFFVDDEGIARAIECNPRPTSGYHVMASETLAEALILRKSPTRLKLGDNSSQILLPTLISLPALLRAGKFKESMKVILKARDVIFNKDDLMPFLFQFPCAISVFGLAIHNKVSVTSCMMDGVEWNGVAN